MKAKSIGKVQFGRTLLLLAMLAGSIAMVGDDGVLAAEANGDAPGNAIGLPKGKDNNTESDAASPSRWIKIEDLKKDNNRSVPVAKTLRLKQKTHSPGQNEHDKQPRAVKVTKIHYTDINGNEQTITVSSTGGSVAGGNSSSEVDLEWVEANANPKIDWTKSIRVEYDHRDSTGAAAGTTKKVLVNWSLLNLLGDQMDALVPGPGSTMLSAEDTPTVVQFAATTFGISAGEYEAPDLIFFSHDAPKVGNILFVPLGQFKFASTPAAVLVFDGEGTNLITAGALTLEYFITANGELAVSVVEVDEALIDRFAMIVRGVEISLDEGIDEDTVHSYTIGGSAFSHLTSGAAAIVEGNRILDNWEVLAMNPAWSLTMTDVPTWDEDEEVVVNQRVGRDCPIVVTGADNVGFLSAFVIEGHQAGGIHEGDIKFTPTGGLQFVEDANTKLYVVNAANGQNVSGDVEATISVLSSGALRVRLLDLGTAANLKLRLIVVNPKVAYNVPLAYGHSCEININGAAVRCAMRANLTLLEGGDAGSSDPAGPLPSQPVVAVHGWSPAAAMEE